jgi:glycosyltransferase involved in cell wall biosynthesis
MLVANQAWNLVNYREGLIRALMVQGFEVVACAPPEPGQEARLREWGCRFVALPLSADGLSPVNELRTLSALRDLIHSERPAALLSWTIKANLWGGLAARAAGIPYLPNVSGLGITHERGGVLRVVAELLYRVCLGAAPTVFFQNNDDLETLADRGAVRRAQTVLLPGSGIDLQRFRAPRSGRPTSRRYLLAARLLGSKGVREFVSAARAIRQRRSDLRFALLGFADVAARDAICLPEIESWRREGVIEYFPPVADVRPFLADCEAVVLPSYYREGLSRALLEAAAMGRPIVTTDHPGCRETIEPGVTGELCRPRDVASLVEAIERVAARSPAEWQRMSDAARARAETRFSQDIVVESYLAALGRAGVTSSRSPSASS